MVVKMAERTEQRMAVKMVWMWVALMGQRKAELMVEMRVVQMEWWRAVMME